MAHIYTTAASRWTAVCRRDPSADGSFVYAVRTTKIYCRPVCKARLARQANVEFYDDGRAAERSGYRACKRCKPEAGVSVMPEAAAVVRIRSLIERELLRNEGTVGVVDGEGAESTSTGLLARRVKVSKWHFHRVFKELTGVTPSEYYQRRAASSHTSSEASPATDMSYSASSASSSTPLDLWSQSPGGPGSGAEVSWDEMFTTDSFDDMIDWSMFEQTALDEGGSPFDLDSSRLLPVSDEALS